MKFKIRMLLAISIFSISCGEGIVDLDEQVFEPKIVIQGTIFPHQRVDDIKISRNFPLNTPAINKDDIVVKDAQVILLDEAGAAYDLRFNSRTARYEYRGADLVIDYGKRYTLEVSATIDGESLFARSTTTVPQAGFEILDSKSVLGEMVYRERDENNVLKNFEVTFARSPGTDFYALSLTAMDAEVSSFIFENPYDDLDEQDVLEDFADFKYTYTWIQDTPLTAGESRIEIFWFFTWFYGNYRAVVYAGDKNFKDFLLTHNQVQEIDGNFHEPAFHIEGDGIGVFGSAIADTVYFRILKN